LPRYAGRTALIVLPFVRGARSARSLGRKDGREGESQGGKNKRTRSWNRSPVPSGRRPPDDSATRAPPLNGTLINPNPPPPPPSPPLHQANQAAEPVLSRETPRGRCQQARARAFQAPSFFYHCIQHGGSCFLSEAAAPSPVPPPILPSPIQPFSLRSSPPPPPSPTLWEGTRVLCNGDGSERVSYSPPT